MAFSPFFPFLLLLNCQFLTAVPPLDLPKMNPVTAPRFSIYPVAGMPFPLPLLLEKTFLLLNALRSRGFSSPLTSTRLAYDLICNYRSYFYGRTFLRAMSPFLSFSVLSADS